MTNFATAIKDEIRRLARKEIKAQLSSVAKTVAQHRREIAALKRKLHEQERKLASSQNLDGRSQKQQADEEQGEGIRFSARSVKSQRQRLGLSAADYAMLVGVSALTIYNWEQGKTRPRREQLASLAALRGIGKREARAKLESSTQGGNKSQKTRRKLAA